MSSEKMPIRFRAVHTKTLWRKARHKTLENARSDGNRSARALFAGENDAIDLAKHGQPLYVVIWAQHATSGEVLKPDVFCSQGFRSEIVPLNEILEWEKAGGVPIEELERHFSRGTSTHVAQQSKTIAQSPSSLPDTVEQIESHLQIAISESRSLSQEARQNRLARANPIPRQLQVKASVFIRNADVIVEVMIRADGRCEVCGSAAPFQRRSDGSPYLEVHHIVPLARGGHDTVENAQALCPNCHRFVHFGSEAI